MPPDRHLAGDGQVRAFDGCHLTEGSKPSEGFVRIAGIISATLYLIEQNTILRKTSDRLRLCRMRTPLQRKSHVTEGEVLLELPCADIDHIMLFGNVQITTPALQELLQHGIEIALFTRRGKLLGQLTPPNAAILPGSA